MVIMTDEPDHVTTVREGGKPLRFLCNIHNPSDPNARRYLKLIGVERFDPAARDRAWERHMQWVNANVIGEPQATEAYSSEQLKGMNMVGLYAGD